MGSGAGVDGLDRGICLVDVPLDEFELVISGHFTPKYGYGEEQQQACRPEERPLSEASGHTAGQGTPKAS